MSTGRRAIQVGSRADLLPLRGPGPVCAATPAGISSSDMATSLPVHLNPPQTSRHNEVALSRIVVASAMRSVAKSIGCKSVRANSTAVDSAGRHTRTLGPYLWPGPHSTAAGAVKLPRSRFAWTQSSHMLVSAVPEGRRAHSTMKLHPQLNLALVHGKCKVLTSPTFCSSARMDDTESDGWDLLPLPCCTPLPISPGQKRARNDGGSAAARYAAGLVALQCAAVADRAAAQAASAAAPAGPPATVPAAMAAGSRRPPAAEVIELSDSEDEQVDLTGKQNIHENKFAQIELAPEPAVLGLQLSVRKLPTAASACAPIAG